MRPSAIATSKTGQAVEMRLIADATAIPVGSDLPLRVYVGGEKKVGVKVRATHVASGKTAPKGEIPTNLSGGLIGYGHYTGGTGVRQAADIAMQFTGKPDGQKIEIDSAKPYGLMISMGGNDRTVVSCVFRKVN